MHYDRVRLKLLRLRKENGLVLKEIYLNIHLRMKLKGRGKCNVRMKLILNLNKKCVYLAWTGSTLRGLGFPIAAPF